MKKKSIIEFLIVLTVGVGSTLIFINQRKASYKAKIESGDFAIGTFIQFGVNLVGYSHYYKYYYHSKQRGKIFYVDSGRMPDDKLKNKIKKGDQFFVIYNDDGASIFFDKPIKDSIDFKRYVKEFEEMRKQKAKE